MVMASELFKIILTSSLTVFGGIVVFVSGQVAAKFFIEPIHEQDKCLGEIANLLILFASLTYSNKQPPVKEDPIWEEIISAQKELRAKASELQAATFSIRGYRFFRRVRLVRLNRERALEMTRDLIGWSNMLMAGDGEGVNNKREKIADVLGVPAH